MGLVVFSEEVPEENATLAFCWDEYQANIYVVVTRAPIG
jgi:hypothetical protein